MLTWDKKGGKEIFKTKKELLKLRKEVDLQGLLIQNLYIREKTKRGKEKIEEDIRITDLTGDMTDTEFELIVDRTYERIMSNIHEVGKQEIRKILEYYRVDLLTLQSMDIKLKFGYNTGYFSQILERIRRRK